MKVESRLLLGLGAFILVLGLVYLIWSGEVAGGVMLIGTAILALFPGLYYAYWHKRMGNRVEDLDDATIEAGAGYIGAFPGSSIWPFVLGMGAFTLVLSLVFGTWFVIPGIALVAFALSGGTAESRRGGAETH